MPRTRLRSAMGAYLLLSPFILHLLLFWLIPVVLAGGLAFFRWSPQHSVFVGFDNFTRLFVDPSVRAAFRNAGWYLVANNLVQISAALGLALLLNSAFVRARSAWRALFFIPYLISAAVAGILFQVMFSKGGVLAVLTPQIDWLHSTSWAKPAVLLASSWKWIGYWVIIFLAGLQSVPRELEEAAAIDGASRWQILRHVTLPTLRPIIFFVLLVNSVQVLQLFEEPFVLFPNNPGGPASAATTPVVELYNAAFESFDLGYAAAIGWALTIIVVAITVFEAVVLRKRGWSS